MGTKAKLIPPIPEEDERIDAGIAADQATAELAHEQFVSARKAEAELLRLAVRVGRGELSAVTTSREANVLRVAAMLLPERQQAQSRRLAAAAQAFFDSAPDEQLDAGEVVRRGWIASLPRLHERITASIDNDLMASGEAETPSGSRTGS